MIPISFHTLPGATASEVRGASLGMGKVKVCGSGDIAVAKKAGAWVYYRPFLGGQDQGDCQDGVAWAAAVWKDLLANGGTPPDAICFRNECGASVQTGQQYIRYRYALRALGFTGLVVLGSFSTGTPDWPEWDLLRQGMGQEVPDAVDLHEYWDMTVDGSAPWWALRHREAIRRGVLSPDWPIIVGETGSDAVVKRVGGTLVPVEDSLGRRGWQDRGKLTAAQQGENLLRYRSGVSPSVLAIFVFADGGSDPNWLTYHTFGTPVEDTIRASWDMPRGKTVASLAIPLDNQLTSDGPNKYNECGPASIRMVCDYLGIDPGESIDAIDTDETGDESLIGYTTTQQMVTWFSDRGIPAVQSQPESTASAIAANLARGWPCIYLGVWDRQAMTGGHFEVPISDDGANIALNNPYGGYVETLGYDDIDRYSLGWLVTVQETKEASVDPTLQAASLSRCSALGNQPNVDGALFKAYARQIKTWLANGQDALSDPTPLLIPETVPDPATKDAYWMLDSGVIWHWKAADGLVYQAEQKERAGIIQRCGWAGKGAL